MVTMNEFQNMVGFLLSFLLDSQTLNRVIKEDNT